ncbi:MAG: glycosyltransferase family 2 protein [Sphingobium sp.]
MTNGPRVSVVMPFHNAGRHMDEAIRSVVTQTFADWELLLVDDRSGDEGPAIARRFADGDARIRLLSTDGGRFGAAAARNIAIATARGDYVAFLDADDLFGPHKLAHDVAALECAPEAAWVYSATRWFFEDEKRRDYRERLGVRRDRTYPPPDLLRHVILQIRGDIPCTCGVMIRKAALDAVGGFEERFALYEDQSLWVKLLLAYPVHVRSGCDAAYRQHDASTSSMAVVSGAYDQHGSHSARDAFLGWIEDYAEEHDAPPSIFRAIDKAKRENEGRGRSPMARLMMRLNRLFY